METAIKRYDTATIYARNDNYNSSNNFRIGSDEIFIEAEISNVLQENGIRVSYDGNETSLKVECHFFHGWGLPRLRRHFKVAAKYISFINIKFIDSLRDEVIGEIEYKKPLFQTSQKDMIKNIINELIKSYQTDIKKDKESEK